MCFYSFHQSVYGGKKKGLAGRLISLGKFINTNFEPVSMTEVLCMQIVRCPNFMRMYVCVTFTNDHIPILYDSIYGSFITSSTVSFEKHLAKQQWKVLPLLVAGHHNRIKRISDKHVRLKRLKLITSPLLHQSTHLFSLSERTLTKRSHGRQVESSKQQV